MDNEGLAPSLEVSPDLARLYQAVREVMSLPLSKEELKGFGRKKWEKPNPYPFIKFEDLNNKIEKDFLECNPERPAVSIGLKWEF